MHKFQSCMLRRNTNSRSLDSRGEYIRGGFTAIIDAPISVKFKNASPVVENEIQGNGYRSGG